MSILSRFFPANGYNTTNLDARISELDGKQRELEEQIVAADGRVVEEMLESGASPSAQMVDELRRKIAYVERTRSALEQERSVVAKHEEEIRVAKVWRAHDDFARSLANDGPALEAEAEHLRVRIEAVLQKAKKLKEMTPVLPEGIEYSTFLEGGLLSAVISRLHSDNFRQSARSASVAAMISDWVGLCSRERPDELHSGTRMLLKPSPSHDASAKA